MRRFVLISIAVAAGLMVAAAPAGAQQPAAPPAPIPEKMPFDIPYGAPIAMEMAKKAADAALAEATKRGWKMTISVVSPSGDLTYFMKMDDAPLASVTIAPRKARTAARFRRDIKVFLDLMESGHSSIGTLDPDLIAGLGGLPIVIGGKLIGAMGCGGGTGAQDAVICQAGVDALGK
jgi:glc operon protein GlcG